MKDMLHLYCERCDMLTPPCIDLDTIDRVIRATCPTCGSDVSDGVVFEHEQLVTYRMIQRLAPALRLPFGGSITGGSQEFMAKVKEHETKYGHICALRATPTDAEMAEGARQIEAGILAGIRAEIAEEQAAKTNETVRRRK